MPHRFITALPRRISVWARHYRSGQERRRIEAAFHEWRKLLESLPPEKRRSGELLVIRLDDIGDYLLFRNQLAAYRRSTRFRGQRITLLGNEAWRALFEAFDAAAVDEVLWVNKAKYLTDAAYRREVWVKLRDCGIDTVVAPSRTRPLLLDDLCMLAAAPRESMGAINTYVHASWNRVSDALYSSLFTPPNPRVHEFEFNAEFAEWACGAREVVPRPSIELSGERIETDYLLCFLGANTRSKRWPAKRWIELIEGYRAGMSNLGSNARVVLAGQSNAERLMAEPIQAATGAESIVGRVSLLEFVDWVRGARAVVTNDTMAAHLAVSLSRPTVIVANGVNHQRFTDYDHARIDGVATAYPAVYLRKRARNGDFDHHYADAITADIASIRGADVLALLRHVMP